MEFIVGNLFFSSNFDSGNLLNVEKVISCEDNFNNYYGSQSDPLKMDYEFNVWTKPDCYGTEFENINRTWSYFYVMGYIQDKMMKITIKNLNRQQRLYSQGYCPLFKTDTRSPENDKWCRIRFRPSWASDGSNFQLSFAHHLSEVSGSKTYFAFCYPWSYEDCQEQLNEIESKYQFLEICSWETLSKMDSKTVYYKRESFTNSFEGRRIDLMTITDMEGMSYEREEHFDEKLFPEKLNRPCEFNGKKNFVVTYRVHPGKTRSSHVFNGFLNLILRPNDPRSIQLRKQYFFKLIPLLNPDGVFRGHYRTDSREVNLNRVYLNPNFKLHSPIYAAKFLVLYHHIYNGCIILKAVNALMSQIPNVSSSIESNSQSPDTKLFGINKSCHLTINRAGIFGNVITLKLACDFFSQNGTSTYMLSSGSGLSSNGESQKCIVSSNRNLNNSNFESLIHLSNNKSVLVMHFICRCLLTISFW